MTRWRFLFAVLILIAIFGLALAFGWDPPLRAQGSRKWTAVVHLRPGSGDGEVVLWKGLPSTCLAANSAGGIVVLPMEACQ